MTIKTAFKQDPTLKKKNKELKRQHKTLGRIWSNQNSYIMLFRM